MKHRGIIKGPGVPSFPERANEANTEHWPCPNQVSATTMEPCRVLVWHRDRLRLRTMADAHLSTAFDHVIGKDVVAKAVHYGSLRAERPFVTIPCSALTETLLESELFGHERGAFTDARTTKKGLFEVADGGSAFLDEIGEMGPAMQAKLLRLLEEKAFKRVGGTRDIRVDVRVIAATNRRLEQAVAENRFRADLFYRLNVIPI